MKKKLIALALFSSVSLSSFADIKSVESALEREDAKAATQEFSTLSEQEKNSLEGQILSGRILLVKDDTENAFEHFEELQVTNKDNVDINYYLGVSAVIMAQKASIFSKLGYAEDFIVAMERTVQLKPDHIDALNTLIGFHLGAPSIAGGDTDKALLFAKQLQQYDEQQGYAQVANVYWQTDKPELAEQTMLEAFKKHPESGTLYFARAQAHIRDEGWSAAREDLKFAIKFAEDDEKKSQALYQQGKVSAESGDQAELGINSLTEALTLADKQYKPWVKYRLAQLYVQEMELSKAQSLIAKIDIEENEELESKVKKLKKQLKKKMKS